MYRLSRPPSQKEWPRSEHHKLPAAEKEPVAFNAIEPKWIHGKRKVVEPDGLLTAYELADRVCGSSIVRITSTYPFPKVLSDHALGRPYFATASRTSPTPCRARRTSSSGRPTPGGPERVGRQHAKGDRSLPRSTGTSPEDRAAGGTLADPEQDRRALRAAWGDRRSVRSVLPSGADLERARPEDRG